MRIHLYQQFFSGPRAPGPSQPRKLIRRLAEYGHEVIVLACDFNAYSEETEPEEGYSLVGGGTVQIRRISVPRQLRLSLRNRLRAYGLFAWRAYCEGRQLPKPDIVLGSIQPLFTGLAAMRVAKVWKTPLALEVRDLWPDALVVKGAIKAWQAQPLFWLEGLLYSRACRVVSLTPGIKTELLRKKVPSAKIDVLPNAFDPELFQFNPSLREKTRQAYVWNDRFVAVFTGVHTEVTAVETIVRAAALLRERNDIRFDLFGTGQSKAGAVRLAESLGLTNIHFHDPVPKSEVPAILAGADAGLMTLFKSPLIHIYFENKLIDYMAAGKPILAAMDGIQGDIIRRFGAGKVVRSLDHIGLAGLVAEAADDPASAREMGQRGRKMIQRHLPQSEILDRYCRLVEAVARGESASIPPWEPFKE